jgi:ATP-dependent Lon protease
MTEPAEKIIELTEVVSEPEPPEPEKPFLEVLPGPEKETSLVTSLPDLEEKIKAWVEEKAESIIQAAVQEKIQKQLREIMVREVEKAIQEEIERLKRA